jgi:hypothetical protein
MLQDRFDRAMGDFADVIAASAGRIDACRAVPAGEPQNAETGAEALLGMGLAFMIVSTRASWRGRSWLLHAAFGRASTRRSAGARSACAGGLSYADVAPESGHATRTPLHRISIVVSVTRASSC